jgi:hypothetical protein
MTPEQFAGMKPGDEALLRVTLLPRGDRGNAGDHIEVKVDGAATFFAPIGEIVGVLHPVERRAQDAAIIAALCGEHGRKAA